MSLARLLMTPSSLREQSTRVLGVSASLLKVLRLSSCKGSSSLPGQRLRPSNTRSRRWAPPSRSWWKESGSSNRGPMTNSSPDSFPRFPPTSFPPQWLLLPLPRPHPHSSLPTAHSLAPAALPSWSSRWPASSSSWTIFKEQPQSSSVTSILSILVVLLPRSHALLLSSPAQCSLLPLAPTSHSPRSTSHSPLSTTHSPLSTSHSPHSTIHTRAHTKWHLQPGSSMTCSSSPTQGSQTSIRVSVMSWMMILYQYQYPPCLASTLAGVVSCRTGHTPSSPGPRPRHRSPESGSKVVALLLQPPGPSSPHLHPGFGRQVANPQPWFLALSSGTLSVLSPGARPGP
jgi:hypothetical protein